MLKGLVLIFKLIAINVTKIDDVMNAVCRAAEKVFLEKDLDRESLNIILQIFLKCRQLVLILLFFFVNYSIVVYELYVLGEIFLLSYVNLFRAQILNLKEC